MARPDYASWRAQVDKELNGASFDKLVQVTAEGIALQPLYVDAVSANAPLPPPGIGVCMRANASTVESELAGGADAIWVDTNGEAAAEIAHARGVLTVFTSDYGASSPKTYEESCRDFDAKYGSGRSTADDAADASPNEQPPDDEAPYRAWLGFDPMAATARGHLRADAAPWNVRAIVPMADSMLVNGCRPVSVSSLPYHDAGADAADELALMMSTTVAYLRALMAGPFDAARAASALWFQVAIGRDTFGEIAKLRALRLLGTKVFAAAGAPDARIDAVHAVCSERTLAQRDPWVNMLRVTTQVFAAAVGGAQLVTPQPFDAALGAPSDMARRAARNTALVLRDESHLGKVVDAAGGSYYLEARTDALAREAWKRFSAMEREGGIVKLLETGAIHERMANAWKPRAAAIAKRKEPVLGVSEFANLDEKLPTPAATTGAADATDSSGRGARAKSDTQVGVGAAGSSTSAAARAKSDTAVGMGVGPAAGAAPTSLDSAGSRGAAGSLDSAGSHGVSGLPRHREGEAFEALRTRVELGTTREVVLFPMGPAAEHRGRVGFAQSLFATAGLRTREVSAGELDYSGLSEKLAAIAGPVEVACLCGSDERYAGEAVSLAASLKTAGVKHIMLAGRPGDLEKPLRLAGCEHFIYLGCDVIATVEGVLR
jgi:methylmalonyl-CoA mutase